MSVIGYIVLMLFLAVVLWFIQTKFASMNSVIKTILTVALIGIAIALTLFVFGIWDEIRGMQVPKI